MDDGTLFILGFLGGILLLIYIAWHIIKRMIYSGVYIAKKAIEDAKRNSKKNGEGGSA